MAGLLRRRFLVALVVALALLGAAAAWLWRARHELTAQALRDVLAARGAAPVSLRVKAVGPRGLVIEDLRLGEPPDLRVERLALTLSPGSAAAARLASARAEGVRLRGRLDRGGLDLGAAHELLLGDDDAEGPLLLPARRVVLQDARVELETPAGPLILQGGLAGEEAPDGSFRVHGDGALRHRWGRAPVTLSVHGSRDGLVAQASATLRPADALPVTLRAPLPLEARVDWSPNALDAQVTLPPVDGTLQLAGRTLHARLPQTTLRVEPSEEGAPRARLEAGDGALRDPTTGLGATLERVDATLRPDALDGELALAVQDLHDPPRISPLRARVRLGGEPLAPLASVVLAPPGGNAVAQLQVLARAADAGWQLRMDLLPVDLAAVDVPARVPGLAAALGDPLAFAGELEARAHLGAPGGDGAAVEVDLALRDVDVSTGLASVAGLHGRLGLRGPPWRTPGAEVLAMQRLDLGLVLHDGTMEVLLQPEGRIVLREATWRFAGGRIRAGAELGGPGATRGTLVAEDLDVAQLVDLLALEGLDGTGTLVGSLPVRVEEERLQVEGGVLRSVGGGTLRWRPPLRAAFAGRPGMDLVLAALEDFHYERIELTFDGDLRGAVDVALHLRGRNPNLEGGRPVELNVNVDARLADLVQAGRASYRVPEYVEERLRDFSSGRDR